MPDRYGDPAEPVDVMPDDVWSAEHSRALAVVNCGLCDDEGYRGGVVCDHFDRTEIHRRGIARCRAALAEAQARRESAQAQIHGEASAKPTTHGRG